MSVPTVGSLFSGAGGFDLGFEAAGFDVRWQVELDRDAVSVLERHWPDVTRYGDIREVSALACLCNRNSSSLDRGETSLNVGSGVGEPVTVRAEDDAILDGVGSTGALGDDVVSVARRFPPATAHASVTVPAANGPHPGRCVGVDSPLGDDIASALVPRLERAHKTEILLRCSSPSVGPESRLMSSDPEARPSSSIAVRQCSAASALAENICHELIIPHSLPLTVLLCGAHLTPVDVITAGFPCQDVSVAGKRAGLSGARTGLFWQIIRIVEEMREATNGSYPAFVVLENVPGLLSSNSGEDFLDVLTALADIGAVDIAWRVLDAQWWGVPQRRRRVFVVADFAAERAPSVLFEPEGMHGHPPAGEPAREGAASGAEGGAGGGGEPICIKGAAIGREPENGPQYGEILTDGTCYTLNTVETHAVMAPVAAFGGNRTSGPIDVATACNAHGGPNGRQDFESETFVVGPLVSGGTPNGHGTAGINSQAVQSGHVIPVAAPLTAGGHPNRNAPGRHREDDENLVAFAENGRAELRETSVAQALSSGGGKPGQGYSAVREGAAVRRLTPTECSRLQGWPDDHVRYRTDGTELPDGARYRLIGNGVAAPVAEWIARRLRAALEPIS